MALPAHELWTFPPLRRVTGRRPDQSGAKIFHAARRFASPSRRAVDPSKAPSASNPDGAFLWPASRSPQG